MAPKVSVCIDSFNYGRFLPEAIESVLNQSFQDFELIIGDDCSNDGSLEIARKYAARDERIVVEAAPGNRGMVKNRNACLSRARGDYVKWLHADDFLFSRDALARMAAVLDGNHAVSLVASREKWSTNSPGRSIRGAVSRRTPHCGTTVINRCLLEQRNLIGGPSAVMFRRALAGRGFDEGFFVMADLEMWFHLLEQGCFLCLRDPLCAVRIHPRQQTAKDRSALAPALENRELLRRYLSKNYVQLRRWIWKYLEYDAVRRIVRRSRKLKLRDERVDQAVREWGGWKKFRGSAFKYRYREALLKIRRLYERHLRRPIPQVGTKRPLGVNVAGFAQSVYGVGESSRALWRAVQATGLPCVLLNVRSNVHRNTDESVNEFSRENPYRVNLMTFSFDYSRRFFRDMGPRFLPAVTTSAFGIGNRNIFRCGGIPRSITTMRSGSRVISRGRRSRRFRQSRCARYLSVLSQWKRGNPGPSPIWASGRHLNVSLHLRFLQHRSAKKSGRCDRGISTRFSTCREGAAGHEVDQFRGALRPRIVRP